MTIVKAKDIETALCKKGFAKENNDHRKFRFYANGVRTNIWTMTSHNDQEVNGYLQSCMGRQMHLTKNEFLLFVTCTMNQDKYVEVLKHRGHL